MADILAVMSTMVVGYDVNPGPVPGCRTLGLGPERPRRALRLGHRGHYTAIAT